MKKKLKIAIIGYGQMGKMVEQTVIENGDEVSVIIDNEEDWKEKYAIFCRSDVAIEFSTPETVIDNLKKCFQAHIPVVCGTTGWYDRIEEVVSEAKKQSASLMYGSNFSVGANLFFMLNRFMAELLNQQMQYDVTIDETHHIRKKDAPSGTAITTAQIIMSQLTRKKGWTLDENPSAEEIGIRAFREGETVGMHQVLYTSLEDEIAITHNAHSRFGFARGAFLSACWLTQHKGVYEFKEVFPQFLK